MALIPSLVRLGRRSPRLAWFVRALFREWYGLPVPPGHYYSPYPDVVALKANAARWYREDIAPGIDWNAEGQLALVTALATRVAELGALPSATLAAAHGQGYGEVEASVLYLMLRHLKPRRVIEVGSGASTLYIDAALSANRAAGAAEPRLTCIEPFPNDALRARLAASRAELMVREVQDAGVEPFAELERGDVLFIDSTHVSRTDSDVNFLVLDVLPRLAPGVVVHFHDIPMPYPSTPPGHPLYDYSLIWNEAALVRAFLSFNTAFRILMAQAWLHVHHPAALRALHPGYDPARHFPTSLWIVRGG
ncbi:MAG TPA: class I SAM-dependent methyltransferase [Gemmatimonadaceae bacterium]|nr:class I SAM-dependent methyltransferase [Gemmatimonadaceae bacterium]